VRRLAALASLIAFAAAPAAAQAFSGASVRGGAFPTSFGARAVLVRIQCPPRTQSTPRPGDFSFCTGTIVLRRGARVVASVPFSVRTYDSHVEKVVVRRGARSLFQPGRRVALGWTIRSHDGQGQWATTRGSLTAFNPYSRL
jgi:hypothetical protein